MDNPSIYSFRNRSRVWRLVLSYRFTIFDSNRFGDTSAGTSDTLGTFTSTADTPTVSSRLG